MRQELELGSAPANEECAQVGKMNYQDLAKKECGVYKRQLERVFKSMPPNTFFAIKAFQHDFGSYYEVAIFYEDDSDKSAEYAFNVEENVPLKWDKEALDELNELQGQPR